MVNLNFWFVPRSRSTVALRCLSNIPDSTTYFEKFTWARFAEECPYFLNDLVFEASNFETRDQIVAQVKNNSKRYKILQDVSGMMKREHYPIIINKESVNLFLIRHPALTLTSWVPTLEMNYFDFL